MTFDSASLLSLVALLCALAALLWVTAISAIFVWQYFRNEREAAMGVEVDETEEQLASVRVQTHPPPPHRLLTAYTQPPGAAVRVRAGKQTKETSKSNVDRKRQGVKRVERAAPSVDLCERCRSERTNRSTPNADLTKATCLPPNPSVVPPLMPRVLTTTTYNKTNDDDELCCCQPLWSTITDDCITKTSKKSAFTDGGIRGAFAVQQRYPAPMLQQPPPLTSYAKDELIYGDVRRKVDFTTTSIDPPPAKRFKLRACSRSN